MTFYFFKKASKPFIYILFFGFYFFVGNVFSNLKINEIYPAPPTGQLEWIEVYNDSDEVINLSDYFLSDWSGKKIIFSTQSALPKGFLLATSSGVLNNSGLETVFLIKINNQSEELIDIATYRRTFNSNQSYGRCPDGEDSWSVFSLITQGQTNGLACLLLSPSPTPTNAVIFNPTPTILLTSISPPALISYENIFLSEVMVNPSTGENEWVEVYNNNDFSVSLVDWYIDDVENSGGSPKKLSLSILPKNYATVELTTSIFNNDGDIVRLLDFNKIEKDGFEYQNSEKGKSWGRVSFDTDLFCLQEPSKNQTNNSCLSSIPTINSTKTLSSTSSVSVNPESSPMINKPTLKTVAITRQANQKIYKSYSLKENGEVLGVENLGSKMIKIDDFTLEKDNGNHHQNSLVFLLLYYSALTNFLFLRKILMAIEIK